LRIAERRLARPGDELAHVEMDVLAAFRQYAVKGPYGHIAGEHQHDRARPLGIDQRVGEAFKRCERGAECGDGHAQGDGRGLGLVQPDGGLSSPPGRFAGWGEVKPRGSSAGTKLVHKGTDRDSRPTMCRWIAYRGETIALEHYVTAPAHSLVEQS